MFKQKVDFRLILTGTAIGISTLFLLGTFIFWSEDAKPELSSSISVALLLSVLLASVPILSTKQFLRVLEHDIARAMHKTAHQFAHDVRSPLSAIRIVSKRARLSQPEKDLLEASTQRLNKIAEDILFSSRPPTSPCSLSEILESSLKEKCVETSHKTGLSLQAQIPNSESTYNIDPMQLSRVLSNLLNNAIEATQNRQGKISLTFKETPTSGQITIADNGHGIPEPLKEKIWSRGFSHGKSHGHGLGLSHAKETIESWGGSINIKSHVNQGTEVTIQIPKLA